jgi:hypothetical protein
MQIFTRFNINLLPPKMPFSSQNPEDRIATAISTYGERDNPKMSNWAPEFDVPYYTLRGRINGRKSKAGHPGANKALNAEQEVVLIHLKSSENTLRRSRKKPMKLEMKLYYFS